MCILHFCTLHINYHKQGKTNNISLFWHWFILILHTQVINYGLNIDYRPFRMSFNANDFIISEAYKEKNHFCLMVCVQHAVVFFLLHGLIKHPMHETSMKTQQRKVNVGVHMFSMQYNLFFLIFISIYYQVNIKCLFCFRKQQQTIVSENVCFHDK